MKIEVHAVDGGAKEMAEDLACRPYHEDADDGPGDGDREIDEAGTREGKYIARSAARFRPAVQENDSDPAEGCIAEPTRQRHRLRKESHRDGRERDG